MHFREFINLLSSNQELLNDSFGVMMVVWGTYLLSGNIFGNALKKLVNVEYSELPLIFKIFIMFFGSKKAFTNKTLWESESYPLDVQFTKVQKRHLFEPFWGFFLICVGSVWTVFGYSIFHAWRWSN